MKRIKAATLGLLACLCIAVAAPAVAESSPINVNTATATELAVVNGIGPAKARAIIEHRDDFDLWAWTRMALGLPGVLLGWTPIIQGKVRKTAGAGLDAYMAKHG